MEGAFDTFAVSSCAIPLETSSTFWRSDSGAYGNWDLEGRRVVEYLGIDGFRGGWVAAWIDDRGDHGFDYASSLERLLSAGCERAMIDMPIGLTTKGHRTCDLRARELVGASVFLGARRNLWEFPDQASANRYYWQHEGPGMGVSCQLWNIRGKIREVDDFITPERQATIGEAHPELIFRNLGDQRRPEGKKSARGREQRIRLLADRGFVKLSKWLTQRHGTGIGRDDLIDACACAVAARDSKARLGGDEVDVRGLRMEINY
jgi:predicted RNase H-like nuclease